MRGKKNPCLQCKAKHLRCSDDPDTSQCRRCQKKNLECIRPEKQAPFRHGSSANYDSRFPDSQHWVNSNPRRFRLQTSSGPTRRGTARSGSEAVPTQDLKRQEQHDLGRPVFSPKEVVSPHQVSVAGGSRSNAGISPSSVDTGAPISPPPAYQQAANHATTSSIHSQNHYSPATDKGSSGHTPASHNSVPSHVLDQIHEACLLKHYIEEISHWFDICDPLRRFELLVPERARTYPPLLNAIYAVSTRHLCRLPQYKTPSGIRYKGQYLRDLTPETAVEYMLRCLPALREFHHACDTETRELVTTTAVILRQCEEIDDEHEHDDGPSLMTQRRVNFLSIVNSVLRSSNPEELYDRSELLSASYWIAFRQDIYFALRKGHAPELVGVPKHWDEVSPVNKLIIHSSMVARWLFNDRSADGWSALKDQERHLENESSALFEPIITLPPKREEGEIFPRIWFRSAIALTGVQHFLLAKMILLAESPIIGQHLDLRSAYRETEGQVRAIILELCGSALHHPEVRPALVNATLGINLYGHYFIDHYEREALKGIIQRFKDVCAWPVPRALQAF